jgi:hypothetical protein
MCVCWMGCVCGGKGVASDPRPLPVAPPVTHFPGSDSESTSLLLAALRESGDSGDAAWLHETESNHERLLALMPSGNPYTAQVRQL